jgi:hypothetical protein
MTSRTGQTGASIDRILLTNPGYGYTQPPTVTILGNNGGGAIATAVIARRVLGPVAISSGGVGYSTVPTITFSGGISSTSAIAESVLNTNGVVVSVRYLNVGSGYTSLPSISFTNPTAVTFGDYTYNEVVTGTNSGTTAYVKSWDAQNRILKVSVVDGGFALGESLVGAAASYKISSVQNNEFLDAFAQNIEIEEAADSTIDFSERNPFGEY